MNPANPFDRNDVTDVQPVNPTDTKPAATEPAAPVTATAPTTATATAPTTETATDATPSPDAPAPQEEAPVPEAVQVPEQPVQQPASPPVTGVTLGEVTDATTEQPAATTETPSADLETAEPTVNLEELEQREFVELRSTPSNTFVTTVQLAVPTSGVAHTTIKQVLDRIAARMTSDGHLLDANNDPIDWFRISTVTYDGQSQSALLLDVSPVQGLFGQRWLNVEDAETAILTAAQEALGHVSTLAKENGLFIPPIVVHAFSAASSVYVTGLRIRGRSSVPFRRGAVAKYIHRASDALQHTLVSGSTAISPEQYTGWSRTFRAASDEVLTMRRISQRVAQKELSFVSPVDAIEPEARLEVELAYMASYLNAMTGSGPGSVPNTTLEQLLDWTILSSDEARAEALAQAIHDSGIADAIGFVNVLTWEEQRQGPFQPFTADAARSIARAKGRAAVAAYKATLDQARAHVIDWTNSALQVPPSVLTASSGLRANYGFDFSRPPAFYAGIADFYLQKPHSVDDVVGALIANSVESIPSVRTLVPCSSRAVELAERLRTIQFVDFAEEEEDVSDVAEDHLEDVTDATTDTAQTVDDRMGTADGTPAPTQAYGDADGWLP